MVFMVPYVQEESGAIPINKRMVANKGPTACLYHSGPTVIFWEVTTSEIIGKKIPQKQTMKIPPKINAAKRNNASLDRREVEVKGVTE